MTPASNEKMTRDDHERTLDKNECVQIAWKHRVNGPPFDASPNFADGWRAASESIRVELRAALASKAEDHIADASKKVERRFYSAKNGADPEHLDCAVDRLKIRNLEIDSVYRSLDLAESKIAALEANLIGHARELADVRAKLGASGKELAQERVAKAAVQSGLTSAYARLSEAEHKLEANRSAREAEQANCERWKQRYENALKSAPVAESGTVGRPERIESEWNCADFSWTDKGRSFAEENARKVNAICKRALSQESRAATAEREREALLNAPKRTVDDFRLALKQARMAYENNWAVDPENDPAWRTLADMLAKACYTVHVSTHEVAKP